MNKAAFIIIIALTGLVFLLLLASLLFTRPSGGVRNGDWAKYYFFVEVTTNIPDPKPILGFDPNLNGSLYQFTVSSISAKNVTVQIGWQLANGTEQTDMGEINIETGAATSNFGWYLINPGLRNGSRIYTSEQFTDYYVTDVVLRNCSGLTRETVLLNFTKSGLGSYYQIIPYKGDIKSMNTTTVTFWDRGTGVATNTTIIINTLIGEALQSYYNVVFHFDILESNLPIVPSNSYLFQYYCLSLSYLSQHIIQKK